MWHYKSPDGQFEVHGHRRDIQEQLNIFTVYINGEEEEFDRHRESHWKQVVENYNLTGDDEDE